MGLCRRHHIAKLLCPARSVGAHNVFLVFEMLDRFEESGTPLQFFHLADAKDQHANVDAVQQLIQYEFVRRDYAELSKRGIIAENFNGFVIFPMREDWVEQWTDRYPHPFGELAKPPMVQCSNQWLSANLAKSFDWIRISMVGSDIFFEEQFGLGRLITETLHTWDVQPFVKEPVNNAGALLDLLSMHPSLPAGSSEVDEADIETIQRGENDLVQWLEELLTDHGQRDQGDTIVELVRESSREEDGADHADHADGNGAVIESCAQNVESTLWTDFLTSMSLTAAYSGRRMTLFRERMDKPIGIIHKIGDSGISLKATCRWHGNAQECICWVQPRGMHTDDPIWRSLTRWLAEGAGVTREQHLQSARDVKVSFGMRPR